MGVRLHITRTSFLTKVSGAVRWNKDPKYQPSGCNKNLLRNVTGQAVISREYDYEMAKPFESIPGPKGIYNIPFIGTRLLFKPFSKYSLESVGHMIENLHQTYGPIVCIRFGFQKILLLEDVSDIQVVLQSDPKTPYRAPMTLPLMYEKRQKLKQSLGTCNGEEWQRLRTPLNSHLSRPSSATHYLASQEQVAVDFAARLPRLQSSPAALQEDFFRFAAESIGVVCFNKRLGFLDADFETNAHKKKLLASLLTSIRDLTKAFYGKKFLFLFMEDSFYKNYKQARDYVSCHTLKCIDSSLIELRHKEKEGNLRSQEPNLILSLLSEKSLDKVDVMSILDTLLSGGSDSTACGLQLFFYSLATNPDKQDKLAQEILGEMGQDGSLTADVLERLSYLKASLKESLRIHSPLPGGALRTLNFNAVLSGYQVPKGTFVGISSHCTVMNPHYFENPECFMPERWLRRQDRRREQVINYFAYLPFGFGARKCLGQRFAEQEIYLATVKVLQKYKISVQKDYKELETVFMMFRAPKTPIPFIFTPRNP